MDPEVSHEEETEDKTQRVPQGTVRGMARFIEHLSSHQGNDPEKATRPSPFLSHVMTAPDRAREQIAQCSTHHTGGPSDRVQRGFTGAVKYIHE